MREAMALWSQIVTFLGFDESEQKTCKESIWNHSLFGKAAGLDRGHVRSGDVAQWKREFTPKLAQAFVHRFPDAGHYVLEDAGDVLAKPGFACRLPSRSLDPVADSVCALSY